MGTFGHVYAYMRMRTHAQALHAHTPCMCRVLKLCKARFLHLNLVWNETHIVWELPQTPIF